MALLERVSALVRANLNDLIDKAEEPEKMIKQVILDMQNQLLQVKTQVAIAIADQHLLAKKAPENEEKQAEWMRKAELAVEKKDDALARAALERAMGYKELADNFHQQVARPEDGGREPEGGAPEARRQARRGGVEERPADRAAPARACLEEGERGEARDHRGGRPEHVRSDEGEGRASRGGQPGLVRDDLRRRRRPVRGAGEGEGGRPAVRRSSSRAS